MILRRQMWRQQTDCRQGDGSVGQQFQDNRKAARHTSGFDSSISRVLGEAERLRAVGEKRRAALPEIEPARVQFRERRDQVSRRLTLVCNQPPDLHEQLVVGQVSEGRKCVRHVPCIASQFLPSEDRPSRAINPRGSLVPVAAHDEGAGMNVALLLACLVATRVISSRATKMLSSVFWGADRRFHQRMECARDLPRQRRCVGLPA
jgi:hypothetical protein